jgi:formylglycine-generating enzyme required for sulfatase activity/acetyl esterase/lipase
MSLPIIKGQPPLLLGALLAWILTQALLSVHAVDLRPAFGSVQYAEVDGHAVLMDLYLPQEQANAPYPWLIRFSSSIEKPDAAARMLLENGYALIYASYNSTNQNSVFPPFPQVPAMTQRAVRFLRDNAEVYGLDQARAGVWGWSRGGTAAAMLGATGWTERFCDGSHDGQSGRVAAVIAIAGSFNYVRGDSGGADLRTWKQSDEAVDLSSDTERGVSAWVTAVMPPTLLIRGGNDGSPRDVKMFHDVLKSYGIPTELFIKPGSGHGVGGNDVFSMILRWVDKYVKTNDGKYLKEEPDIAFCVTQAVEAGQFDAANMLLVFAKLKDDGQSGTLRSMVDEREALQIVGQIAALQHKQTSRVAYLELLGRLITIMDRAQLSPDGYALIMQEDQRRREMILKQSEEVGKLQGDPGPFSWPPDLAVPAWAATTGADVYGPWAELAVSNHTAMTIQRFRWCPAGSAELGGAEDDWGYAYPEKTRRRVVLADGFWIGDSEVTQEFYVAVTGENPSYFAGHSDHPVEMINFDKAQEFISKLNKMFPDMPARLPLMDEWLWACRAGGFYGATFAGADDLDPVGWYAGNSAGTTQPVKKKLPNIWGLYDMQGNVWEWCGDSPQIRPAHYRYYAGGAFCSSAGRCRPESVGFHNKANTTWYHGIRIVISDTRK